MKTVEETKYTEEDIDALMDQVSPLGYIGECIAWTADDARENTNAWRIANQAAAELAAKDAELEPLRAEIDKALSKIHGARKTTASDPDNVWCRQATIILNEVYKELAATLERVTK